jgi:hypothetical protein
VSQERRENRPACAVCRHFDAAPLAIEAAFPGLSALSSGFAAVRSNDGVCALLDRYVSASSRCGSFVAST